MNGNTRNDERELNSAEDYIEAFGSCPGGCMIECAPKATFE